MKLKLISFGIFLIFVSKISVFGQNYSSPKNRTIAILDLTLKNAETSNSELFSAKHILKTAGIPFIVTTDIAVAKNYGFILASSKFDLTTFDVSEKDSLINYVNNGGILIAPNLKDPYFNSLFGVSSNTNANNRYTMKFNTVLNDPSFKWLNDSMEKTISFGRTTYPTVINTRSYALSGALSLAKFDDNTNAITKKQYGQGTAYAIGFSFKNLIITNQQNLDYNANRYYSNGFEPTSDALFLFIKGIYLSHTNNAVWLHTSPYNSKTTLMITHDIDATSAYDTMQYYSDYEASMGIKASYFFTTHYIDDALLSDFYNINTIPKIQDVLNKGHIAGSHSVGHFPDFDDETVFPLGNLNNTMTTYLPYNFGTGSTTNGSVLGETEVSKKILDSNFGLNIKTFRAGYLCFNDKIINALDTSGYTNSTTLSAADVLTNFPFQQHKNRSTSGELVNVWEYPMTISDVFSSDPITTTNYPQKVQIWLDVIKRNLENNAPNVLLIHPTRMYKLTAQKDLINALPPGVFVTNLDMFADYWQKRNTTSFNSKLSNDSLLIIIPTANLPLDPTISFVIDNGQNLAEIKASDEFGNELQINKSNFNNNDIILHFENYPVVGINEHTKFDYNAFYLNAFPNPANNSCKITFKVNQLSSINVNVYDLFGNNVNLINNTLADEGWQTIAFNTSSLSAGIYFYTVTVGEKSMTKKLIISH
jgi:hypothetical protein